MKRFRRLAQRLGVNYAWGLANFAAGVVAGGFTIITGCGVLIGAAILGARTLAMLAK